MEAVNYILHMENAMLKFRDDPRITPWHLSLYMSLFQLWNSTRFRSEINIRRDELMQFSKIGSTNTYSKCLKQLSEWKYIKYTPSKSRFKSSKVHMFRFDTTRDTTRGTTPDTSCDTSCGTSCGTSCEHLVRPFLNNTKHIVNNNKLYKTKEGEEKKSSPHSSQIKNEESSCKGDLKSPKKSSKDELHSSELTKSKNSSKADLKPPSTRKRFSPPELQNVKDFFHENKSSYHVAETFFNHFESNGWLVGGKAKMKNWKAAARNWIIRDEKYQAQNRSPAQQRLHVNEYKDYSEPL